MFLEKYGHLRPGTYDILSPRYDEAFELYFTQGSLCENHHNFEFSDQQKEKIAGFITQNNLQTDCDALLVFIQEAIEARETVKFLFTKHLSQILRYIEAFGNKFGFVKEDLAYLDIQTILSLYATLDHRDVKDILHTDIEKNKSFYQYTKSIKLPNLIVEAEDIYSFYLEEGEPNYITLQSIKAKVIREEEIFQHDLCGKIICIQSADPGYDYLFSKSIGGLITCYGGANSHMAIRCAEMGIPAVIGCGEHSFLQYTSASIVEIDALNKQVKILS